MFIGFCNNVDTMLWLQRHFKFRALYLFIIFLSACGGEEKLNSKIPLPIVNSQPVANAGVDQFVLEQVNITLKGKGSDGDGTIVSYKWIQTAGITVTLDNATNADDLVN